MVDGGLRSAAYTNALANLDASLSRLDEREGRALDQITDVILVSSSSRSGSSLLVELLKTSQRFDHLCAEINPFLRLAGLGWPHSSTGSDALTGADYSGPARAILLRHLGAEIGEPGDMPRFVGEDRRYMERLYRRLCIQWPLETFSIDHVRAAATLAQQKARQSFASPADTEREFQLFFTLLLMELRAVHPAINPYYYDLDRRLVADVSPSTPIPSGPPSAVIIEEPPFVLVRPWRSKAGDGVRRPLIVKTPSNAYRHSFLEALFPAARIRTLFLSRNPAASINGLCDGWRHWGFHSHFLGSDAASAGHVASSGNDRGWWKFDLPPGWQDHIEDPLAALCAFQWLSAQTAILERESPQADFRLKFEDLACSFENDPRRFGAFRSWLGDEDFFASRSLPLAPVMSTNQPRRCRWKENADELRGALADGALREVARELGYQDESSWV